MMDDVTGNIFEEIVFCCSPKKALKNHWKHYRLIVIQNHLKREYSVDSKLLTHLLPIKYKVKSKTIQHKTILVTYVDITCFECLFAQQSAAKNDNSTKTAELAAKNCKMWSKMVIFLEFYKDLNSNFSAGWCK